MSGICSARHGCRYVASPCNAGEYTPASGIRSQIIPVGHGELASGLVGDGRMAEPEAIVEFVAENGAKSGSNHAESGMDQPGRAKNLMAGKKALVTAGPTFEPLDPVRFLGNHSTGKMGIAIAEALTALGATVTLVLGPTDLRPGSSGIRVVSVMSAKEDVRGL